MRAGRVSHYSKREQGSVNSSCWKATVEAKLNSYDCFGSGGVGRFVSVVDMSSSLVIVCLFFVLQDREIESSHFIECRRSQLNAVRHSTLSNSFTAEGISMPEYARCIKGG
eukprot:scaffold12487_cov145-Skeletonema_dohrnii-CCMP3373.AAC.2